MNQNFTTFAPGGPQKHRHPTATHGEGKSAITKMAADFPKKASRKVFWVMRMSLSARTSPGLSLAPARTGKAWDGGVRFL